MTFPTHLQKVPRGSRSYSNPFVKVVLFARGNTSHSPFLTFSFRLKFAREPDFFLSFFELGFTHIRMLLVHSPALWEDIT